MTEPLQAYFRVGIVHFMAYPEAMKGQNVLASVREIAEDPFFGSIEVTHIPDPAERAQVAALLASSGLVVGYGAQPVQLSGKLDIGSADPAVRAHALTRLKACIDEAYELGATKFGLLSGPNVTGPDREAAIDRTVQSLVELCTYSRSRGSMTVCLETFDFDIDKRALVGPNALAAEVSARVRQQEPNFGLMVDLSHLPMQHERIRPALHAVREHLLHAHMGNCVMRDTGHPLYGDLHPRFGYPGGENDVPELVEYLKGLMEIGYLTWGSPQVVAFEVKPAPGEESRTVIAHSKRVLLEAWALVWEQKGR